MSQRISSLETKQDALFQQSLRHDSKQEEIISLLNKVVGATGETNRKMSIFRPPLVKSATPEKGAASHDGRPSKRTRPGTSNDGHESQDNVPVAPQQLYYGAAAEANNTGAASNKGKTVGGIIEWFHAEGKLKKVDPGFKFESQDCPPFVVTEMKKFRDAMELVTEAITEEQLSDLKNQELDRETLLRIAGAINMACVLRMKKYETGEGAVLTPTEIKSTNTKATFTALGRRVGTYKQEKGIKTLHETPGTPKGNTSIREHFAPPTH
jgi:hypothetical protein